MSNAALGADVYVMWSSIDCGLRTLRRPIQGSSSANCSIPELINNIKGKSWLKVDEMKSLYNAKPKGREAGEGRRDGRYFFFAGSQGDRILQARAAEETNNPSFINSRLKRRQKKEIEKAVLIIFLGVSVFFFLTVLTQLICFSVNYPLPLTQHHHQPPPRQVIWV